MVRVRVRDQDRIQPTCAIYLRQVGQLVARQTPPRPGRRPAACIHQHPPPAQLYQHTARADLVGAAQKRNPHG
jgi:hypothetical protein